MNKKLCYGNANNPKVLSKEATHHKELITFNMGDLALLIGSEMFVVFVKKDGHTSLNIVQHEVGEADNHETHWVFSVM